MSEQTNLETARQYITLFNQHPIQKQKFEQFVDPDIVWQEMPNSFAPAGRTGDLAVMLAGIERGNEMLHGQQYNIRRAVASGDSVALEIDWTASLAQQAGPFPPDTHLTAHIGIFLRFRGAKIISQHDYVCYEPVSDSSQAEA